MFSVPRLLQKYLPEVAREMAKFVSPTLKTPPVHTVLCYLGLLSMLAENAFVL